MINKEEKIKLIKDLAEKSGITPYQIGLETSISISSATKIFNGEQPNPRTKTLNIILDYLEEAIVGTHSKIGINKEYTAENMIKKGAVAEDMYLNEERNSYNKTITAKTFKKLSIEEKLTTLFELESLNSKKLDVISNAVGKLLLDIEEYKTQIKTSNKTT
ncbi:hypothetical protein ACIVBQ_000449 [Tenacibaculum discolor]